MRHHRVTRKILWRRRVQNQLGICPRGLPLGQVARVNDKHTLDNLSRSQFPVSYAAARREQDRENKRLTLANGGNALGTTNTSGRTFTISPSFK